MCGQTLLFIVIANCAIDRKSGTLLLKCYTAEPQILTNSIRVLIYCCMTEWVVIVFQEWGQSGDLYNLGMLWHVPTAAETSFATVILREFVCAEFDSIQQHINNTRTLTRSDSGWYWESLCVLSLTALNNISTTLAHWPGQTQASAGFLSFIILIITFPSVLWHCWLGDRKDIRPVKHWVLVCWWW